MENITSIGVLGMGSFGKLIIQLSPKHVVTTTYQRSDTDEQFEKVAKCDVLFLAIPLSSYPEILSRLRTIIPSTTMLVDVCSVKMEPQRLIKELLPDHDNILLTHPLFGPESYSIEKKHTLIVTTKTSTAGDELLDYCQKNLGIQILHMSSKEHDERMADVHALTFFIARGLSQLKLIKEPFMTPSFQSIIDLIALDNSQSEELFQTIENGNIFAYERRNEFIDVLNKINRGLH